MIGLIKKIFGSPNEREIKRISARVGEINEFEAGLQKISDDELRESIEANQLKLMKQRGADLTVFSPRASFMAHHIGDFEVSSTWAAICNGLPFSTLHTLSTSSGAPSDRTSCHSAKLIS